ncbi:hypothetical protein [Paracoccus fontiphilus]|nr:hypothetical protein [Paracoccus fontiphilus]
MWTWIMQHAAVVQAVVGLVTAAVWITYLHAFIESMRRQRRSEILITLGGDRGLLGRVLVSNLGLEPIYILDIMLKRCTGSEERIVTVTDRTEVDPAEQTSLDRATLQRPLKSGEYVEIGTIDNMLDRAATRLDRGRSDPDLSCLELTVAAVTAAESSIVAARRIFDIRHEGGRVLLKPRTLYAEQIRGRRGRRRIERQLTDLL